MNESVLCSIDCNFQLILITLVTVILSAGSAGAIAGGVVVAFLAIVAAIAAGCYFLKVKNSVPALSAV